MGRQFKCLPHSKRGPPKHYRKTPLLFTCTTPTLRGRAGEEAQADRIVSQASLAPGGRGADADRQTLSLPAEHAEVNGFQPANGEAGGHSGRYRRVPMFNMIAKQGEGSFLRSTCELRPGQRRTLLHLHDQTMINMSDRYDSRFLMMIRFAEDIDLMLFDPVAQTWVVRHRRMYMGNSLN